jgi:hypothetical protein
MSVMKEKHRTGVNFINILRVHFLYGSKLSSFSLIKFCFAILWHQNFVQKIAHEMNLTAGVNFIKNKPVVFAIAYSILLNL